MKIELDSRFKRKVVGMFGKYEFEVGILKDGPHKEPLGGSADLGASVTGSYAGGPIRKKSRFNSGLQISEVSEANRKRLGINYLSEPFKRESDDIIKFTQAFFKLVFGASTKKRAENLLQAIVRNPILRGEYGPQSDATTAIKGFNRPMIDTAQLFRAITARCTIKR